MKDLFYKYLATLILFPLLINLFALLEIRFLESTTYFKQSKYLFSGLLILLMLFDYKRMKRINSLLLVGIVITIIVSYYEGNGLLVLVLLATDVYQKEDAPLDDVLDS